jgi:hypothetical protein
MIGSVEVRAMMLYGTELKWESEGASRLGYASEMKKEIQKFL